MKATEVYYTALRLAGEAVRRGHRPESWRVKGEAMPALFLAKDADGRLLAEIRSDAPPLTYFMLGLPIEIVEHKPAMADIVLISRECGDREGLGSIETDAAGWA